MLNAIGVGSVDELFTAIPDALRITGLDLPPALTEAQVAQTVRRLSEDNRPVGSRSFLGAGCYQ
ncbi:MAG: hypothetical protein GX536_03935, partial [Actinobacteria bacterium]|nr:hypothetical protein [Actinomycetota bacterium]